MYKHFFKRLIDIIISLIALPFVLIIIIIISPIIVITSGRPIFYVADRIGKNGKIFKMYKFRSMVVNAKDIRNEDGSTYNGDDDDRVTKIGAFLRKTSLDEVPQFLNVLKGDMSLIGPRPNLPTVPFEQLSAPEQKRLAVRAGITGYNQAYFRNSVDTATKYENDAYYVDNLSFVLDLKIILKTVSSVLLRKNINKN